MSTVSVKVRRVEPIEAQATANPREAPSVDELERDLRRARVLAWLLDARFSIGKIRFGLDAIVGLIPAVGDTLTALAGGYLVYLAWKHRMGRHVIAAMVGNLLFDWLVGLVPWLGDMFDVMFKAHLRNLRIFEKAAAMRSPR